MKWLLDLLPKISPLAAAQKQHYETEKLIFQQDHKQEKARLEKKAEVLNAENDKLRSEIERLKKENQALHSDVSILQHNCRVYEDLERERQEPQPPWGSVGL